MPSCATTWQVNIANDFNLEDAQEGLFFLPTRIEDRVLAEY